MPLGLKLLSDRVLQFHSHWIAFETIFSVFVRKIVVLAGTLDSWLPLAGCKCLHDWALCYSVLLRHRYLWVKKSEIFRKKSKESGFLNIKGPLFLMGNHTTRRNFLGLKQDKLPGCKRARSHTWSLTTELLYRVLAKSKSIPVVYSSSS